VLSFQYYSGHDCTILVSKNGGRYRLQSDSLEALWHVLHVRVDPGDPLTLRPNPSPSPNPSQPSSVWRFVDRLPPSTPCAVARAARGCGRPPAGARWSRPSPNPTAAQPPTVSQPPNRLPQELARRLADYYAQAEGGAPAPEGPFTVTYEDALPLEDFHDVVDAYFAARTEVGGGRG
jgi:hypothetical protein